MFHQKKGKNASMKEPHTYVKRKTRELSEKRAVLKELHGHATQKNMKNIKIAKNVAVTGRNTLPEAPGDIHSRNLHPKSGPVESTFLIMRTRN